MRFRVPSCLVISCFVVLACSPSVLAMQGSQSTGGGDTRSRTRGGDTAKPPVTQNPDQSRPKPSQQQLPRLIFVSGRVVTEDGSPIPMGAVIERNCGSRVTREANVDSAGTFSFQVGGSRTITDVMPDASEDRFSTMPGFGSRAASMSGSEPGMDSRQGPNLVGCELRVSLAGYRSSSVMLTETSAMGGQLDAGTIVIQPIARASGTLVSATDLQAPKQARKALERAQKEYKKKQFEEAEKDLQAAVGAYPNYATAWLELGRVYQQSQRMQEARGAYTKSVAADSKFVAPYISLAHIALLDKNWQEVANLTDQALELDPLDFPQGHLFNAVANLYLGKLDVAERSVRKAQRLDSQHQMPQTFLVLADILERKQDIAGSVDQLRSYLKLAGTAPNSDQVRARLEKLEKALVANKQPN